MDAKVWRLLDANANRAREGLRVIEDTARFILVQSVVSTAMRDFRHQIDRLVRAHYGTLLRYRDIENDPGRENSSTRHKEGIPALLASNFKRIEEALRVLEEYGRILSPEAISEFQALRFEMYKYEKEMMVSILTGSKCE